MAPTLLLLVKRHNNGWRTWDDLKSEHQQRLKLLEQLEEEDRAALLKVVDNYLTTAQLHSTHKRLNKKAAP